MIVIRRNIYPFSYTHLAYESEPIRSVVLAQGCVQVETTQTPKAILAPNQMFSSVEGKENISPVSYTHLGYWNNYWGGGEKRTDTEFSFANYNEAERRLTEYKMCIRDRCKHVLRNNRIALTGGVQTARFLLLVIV